MDLFELPIKSKEIRKGVYAKQYRNGVVSINGIRYVMYSMTDAISKFRRDYPCYGKQNK